LPDTAWLTYWRESLAIRVSRNGSSSAFPKPTCTRDFLDYPESISVNYKPREAFAQEGGIQMYVAIQPLVSLIAGILILMIPRLLNYIVAIYLIVIGILGLAKM
jgi:hypothetical protein